MKKMPTIYLRDEQDRAHVTSTPHPDAAWVFEGAGIATRKFDGTCVYFDGEQWWTRREVKPGKPDPSGWIEVDVDPVTGKRMGWEPAKQSSFASQLAEALRPATLQIGHSTGWRAGTYELCGPKINGNPEGFSEHTLVPHGLFRLADVPLDPAGLRGWLHEHAYEGIVWHHPDGRMAKIKRKDYGL